MVATAVIAITATSTALVYMTTMKALTSSMTRGVASRLAQDQLETLGSYSYDQLLVTSQSDLNQVLSPFPVGVDRTAYIPQGFNMANKLYNRGTVVSRVNRSSSGQIVVLSPGAADTGLKQIQVIVQYMQGPISQTYTATSLMTDPNLVPLDGTVYGVVADTSGVAISNAKVYISQNQNWYAVASSTGYYSITMGTGAYVAVATDPAYYDAPSSTLNVLPGVPLLQNFTHKIKQTGQVGGLATARPQHLLISAFYAGNAGDDNDFLELYNPTTSSILITNGFSSFIQIYSISNTNAVTNLAFDLATATASIPAQGYYLIAAKTPTANNLLPNATFLSANPFHINCGNGSGGAAIQNNYGVWLDSVGWANSGVGPPSGIEGHAVNTGASSWCSGAFLLRKTDYGSGLTAGWGNSVDNNSNSSDFLVSPIPAGYPRNASTPPNPVVYGTIASSAAVAATDGFSSGVLASSTGYFLIPNVTTGTWALSLFWSTPPASGYSGAWSATTGGTTVVNPGALTAQDVLLEAYPSGSGGISGQILRSDTLAPASAIQVVSGVRTTLTTGAGSYVLAIASGTQTVLVNNGFQNIGYGELSSTVSVPSNGISTGMNFLLPPAGEVTGQVTMTNLSPYPNLPIHAIYQGYEAATAMTQADGTYKLDGVPVGSVQISPIIDGQTQSSNPPAIALTVPQGVTLSGNNFTVSVGLGTISGTVKHGGLPITTGVLIVASTTTLNGLPLVNNSYRNGPTSLFSTMSDSSGNYSLGVLNQSTYTVYGYFSQEVGTTATQTLQKSFSNIFVSSANTANFAW